MSFAISVHNVSYNYGQTPILQDISFDIPKGSFYIIIGPNGSGKTTLMKIMAGTAKLKKGRVKIMGRPMKDYSRAEIARTIAFVPQNIPDDFSFTVREIVLMGRSPHQGVLGLERKKDSEILARAMKFTGIDHLAKRKTDRLSGGERQRAFIARAICQEPEIILLDEPTAALDLAHQIRIMDLMEKLKNEKGVTIVMVSHDVNLAAMYGDFLLLLKDGRIVSRGATDEVLRFETLEKAYGCTLLVDKSPLGNFPRVTPVPCKLLKEGFMDAPKLFTNGRGQKR